MPDVLVQIGERISGEQPTVGMPKGSAGNDIVTLTDRNGAAPSAADRRAAAASERRQQIANAKSRAAYNALKAGKGVAQAKEAANRTQRLEPRQKPAVDTRRPGVDGMYDGNTQDEAPERQAPRRERRERDESREEREPQTAERRDEREEREEAATERDEQGDESEREQPRARRDASTAKKLQAGLALARKTLPQAAIDAMSDEDLVEYANKHQAATRAPDTERAKWAKTATTAKLPKAAIDAMSDDELRAFHETETQRARTHQQNTERIAQLERAGGAAAGGEDDEADQGAASKPERQGAPAGDLDLAAEFSDITKTYGTEVGGALQKAVTASLKKAIAAQAQQGAGKAGSPDKRLGELGRYLGMIVDRQMRRELGVRYPELRSAETWTEVRKRAAAITRGGEYDGLDDPLGAAFSDAVRLVLGERGSTAEESGINDDDALAGSLPTRPDREPAPSRRTSKNPAEDRGRLAYASLKAGNSVAATKATIARRGR